MGTLLRSFLDGRDGTVLFSVEKFSVMFSCRRIDSKSEIKAYKKEQGSSLDRPPSEYKLRNFGFYIKASFDKVEIFRSSIKPITHGESQWVTNLRKENGKVEVLYAISLKVSAVHVPKEIEYKTQQKIDAAFKWYHEAIAEAENTLKKELQRIYSES